MKKKIFLICMILFSAFCYAREAIMQTNEFKKNQEIINKNNIILDETVIIHQTAEFVKNKMINESTGHDWWHANRVWRNAIKIGKSEQADMFVVQLAALLHDIADWKFHGGDTMTGPNVALEFLNSLNVDDSTINHVCDIIKKLSFKGAKVEQEILTIEGQIVQDADRLDAIGAIGIARAFAYGGFKQREIYNPEIPVVLHNSFETYKRNESPTINHFYEKLLLLKDLMNTKTAKKIAIMRHEFMIQYLEKFFHEVE
jgi:uncharacterized protein